MSSPSLLFLVPLDLCFGSSQASVNFPCWARPWHRSWPWDAKNDSHQQARLVLVACGSLPRGACRSISQWTCWAYERCQSPLYDSSPPARKSVIFLSCWPSRSSLEWCRWRVSWRQSPLFYWGSTCVSHRPHFGGLPLVPQCCASESDCFAFNC